jgi:hypothetical protein
MTRSPCLALALLVAACNSITTPPEPAAFRVLQRPDTLVVPGAVFDTVAVQVVDAAGAPVTGVLVEWSGDGEVIPLNTRTDDVGVARATWTLPGREVLGNWNLAPRTGPSGTYAIVAAVPGLGETMVSVRARAFVAEAISATEYYACGIRSRELWCWGEVWPLAPEGDDLVPPRRVTLPPGVVANAVHAAPNVLCLLDGGDLPWCAVPTFGDRFDRIAGAPPLRQLSHSRGMMCGLARDDGSAWCWSSASGAQRGQSATRVQPGPFVDLVSGADAWCGLSTDGTAWCWGTNDRGQLGDGTTAARDDAAPVSGDARFTAVAAGAKRTCASSVLGEIWCWGWRGGSADNVDLVPARIDAPDVAGALVDVGEAGEIYLLRDERLIVHGEAASFFTEAFGDQRIRQFSVDVLACLINVDGEVHCSWEMLTRIIAHNWGPGAPVPVPPFTE